MSNFLFAIVLMVSTPVIETTIEDATFITPKVVEAPEIKVPFEPKRGKGKGKGKTPDFAKYFR